MVVPTTRLRRFYRYLRSNPVKGFHLAVAEGLAKHPEALVKLCEQSRKELASYNNPEGLLAKVRERIGPLRGGISRTAEFVAAVQSLPGRSMTGHAGRSCEYIERELSPLRTTNGVFDDGTPASSSGDGGMDMLLLGSDNVPVVGELKIGDDSNALLALIQALTYSVELSTPHQYERLKGWLAKTYNKQIASQLGIYTYLIFFNTDTKNDEILGHVKTLVAGLFGTPRSIKEFIRGIALMEAEHQRGDLTFNCFFQRPE